MWFLYEKWKDILVFDWSSSAYLLQGRKNRITRSTNFRIAETSRGTVFCKIPLTKEHLKEAGAWES